MSTPTLPLSIVNKIKAHSQAVRWTVTLKEVRTFSAYCCNINSNGIMGVAKQPVPIISITPNPVCFGEAIDWDLTDSYAPGSSISAWEIDFGDSSTDSGANIATAFGTHIYAAVGSYTITVTIEEGLGKTAVTTRELNVVDCSLPPVEWLFAATDGEGVWALDLSTMTWEERNTGLTGNALYVRSMVIRPGQDHKSDGSHELWIATLDGIYRSTNSGLGWDKLDLPKPEVGVLVTQLDFHHIVFDPNDADIVYVEASYNG